MTETSQPGGSDPAPDIFVAARALAAPATVNRAARTVEVVWSTGARARNFVPPLGMITEEGEVELLDGEQGTAHRLHAHVREIDVEVAREESAHLGFAVSELVEGVVAAAHVAVAPAGLTMVTVGAAPSVTADDVTVMVPPSRFDASVSVERWANVSLMSGVTMLLAALVNPDTVATSPASTLKR